MALKFAAGFGAGTGTTVADDSGSGHPLTVVAGSYTASGHTGPGFQNSLGTNTTGASGTVAAVSGAACTLMAWVKPSSLPTNGVQLICGAMQTGGSTDFALWSQRGDFSTHNVLQGDARLGGGVVAANGTALTVGTWVHVALTFDGANLKLWRDGTVIATVANAGTLASTTNFVIAGMNISGVTGNIGPGVVDDVRYFDSDESANMATWMATPVSGAGDQFTDAGTATITLGATGTQSRVATATGTAGLALGATGTASAQRAATGTAGLTLGATGSSGHIAADAGAAALTLGATGAYARVVTLAGLAELVLGGDGAALHVATDAGTAALTLLATGTVDSGESVDAGTALLTLGATGVQTARRAAVGSAPLVLGAVGTHAAVRTAAGTAVLELLATGVVGGGTVHGAVEPRLTILPNLATLAIRGNEATLSIDQGGTA
ncbi:LamG-like jellyroll fold domain-containing protein [Amycolatopsis rhabdoformis]|uniref:LamG-like jellyroll fold domain-containing protein n=1 Tax=Amycolatopsis rhabdoformis TaxID=1448059 RepID=A0ABZ1HW12_9PSEU|nr:LamG-like jellyroll fold domain-containing protein [Amycolatopsis rhabdoformis]WSE26094.1 LamG-like jellyroll fold domain-containing protein [Amycolatopsis rhabdoformis]